MGPTVCELEGPIPILNRSNTLIAICVSRAALAGLRMLSTGFPNQGDAVFTLGRVKRFLFPLSRLTG
jgi:hypothetical protein